MNNNKKKEILVCAGLLLCAGLVIGATVLRMQPDKGELPVASKSEATSKGSSSENLGFEALPPKEAPSDPAQPTAKPESAAQPTAKPAQPTAKPTAKPAQPTAKPAAKPTQQPTQQPANPAPEQPATQPTAAPPAPVETPAPVPPAPPVQEPEHYHGNGKDAGQCPVCGSSYSPTVDMGNLGDAGNELPDLS